MTAQQRLLNLFIETNYARLSGEHPKKDSLHSAYLTVWSTHRPIMPTADNFERLISDAYYHHVRLELYHHLFFINPDDLFWQEQAFVDEEDDEQDTPSIADLMEEDHDRLKTFLRKHFTKDEVFIFDLALQQHTIEDIAEIMGMKRKDVRSSLKAMYIFIREEYAKRQKKGR